MSRNYIEDKTFEKADFSKTPPEKGSYENCTFISCNFSGSDLSQLQFTECTFKDCDLSLANISSVVLRDVEFTGCKLLGLHFENCSDFLFSVSLTSCNANLTCFYKVKLKKTKFRKCSFTEADFSEADLTEAVFDECDLNGAIFDNTLLEKADLRLAVNYTIDPENNRVKNARFSISGIEGLLQKYQLKIEH